MHIKNCQPSESDISLFELCQNLTSGISKEIPNNSKYIYFRLASIIGEIPSETTTTEDTEDV